MNNSQTLTLVICWSSLVAAEFAEALSPPEREPTAHAVSALSVGPHLDYKALLPPITGHLNVTFDDMTASIVGTVTAPPQSIP